MAIGIPTVKTCCGCCDLRVACTVIAAIRLVGNIVVFILFSLMLCGVGAATAVILTSKNDNEGADSERNIGNHTVAVTVWGILMLFLLVTQIIVSIITILCSYWYIKGATSRKPDKMKYYLIIMCFNILLLVVRLNIPLFIFALLECYTFICSYSVYKEILSLSQAEGVNTTENTVITMTNNVAPPPPPYNTIGDESEGLKSGVYPKPNP